MFCPNADVFKVAFKIFVVRDFDKQNLSHQENSQISRAVMQNTARKIDQSQRVYCLRDIIICNTIHFTKLLTSNIINKASKAAVNVSGKFRNIP